MTEPLSKSLRTLLTMSKHNHLKPQTTARVLWGVRIGRPDWDEEILTTHAERIDDAKSWATAQGFDRFRVVDIDLSRPPNFAATLAK